MKVRERMGTSVRIMGEVKATTDGDQHQDIVTVTTEVWERGGRRREQAQGVRDRVVSV